MHHYRSKKDFSSEKKVVELSKGGARKVYVGVEPASAFYKGEEYHQDFLDKQTSARSPLF